MRKNLCCDSDTDERRGYVHDREEDSFLSNSVALQIVQWPPILGFAAWGNTTIRDGRARETGPTDAGGRYRPSRRERSASCGPWHMASVPAFKAATGSKGGASAPSPSLYEAFTMASARRIAGRLE
jgi:hypothetical protein